MLVLGTHQNHAKRQDEALKGLVDDVSIGKQGVLVVIVDWKENIAIPRYCRSVGTEAYFGDSCVSCIGVWTLFPGTEEGLGFHRIDDRPGLPALG